MIYGGVDLDAREHVAVLLVNRLYEPDPLHRLRADVCDNALTAPPVGVGVSSSATDIEFGPAEWRGWIVARGAVYFVSSQPFPEFGSPDSLGTPTDRLVAFVDFGRDFECSGDAFLLGPMTFVDGDDLLAA